MSVENWLLGEFQEGGCQGRFGRLRLVLGVPEHDVLEGVRGHELKIYPSETLIDLVKLWLFLYLNALDLNRPGNLQFLRWSHSWWLLADLTKIIEVGQFSAGRGLDD